MYERGEIGKKKEKETERKKVTKRTEHSENKHSATAFTRSSGEAFENKEEFAYFTWKLKTIKF